MKLARITLVATAAAALAIPAVAAATPDQPTGKDQSCGVGPNGLHSGSHDMPPHQTPTGGGVQLQHEGAAADGSRGGGGRHHDQGAERGRRPALPEDA